MSFNILLFYLVSLFGVILMAVERSILERPGYWRFLIIENHGSLPCDDESIARKIYDYAVKVKLDKLSEMGFNLRDTYRRFSR